MNTPLAAAWLLVVPSAETIKSHYDTILTTMRTSVSYSGQFSIIHRYTHTVKTI